MIEMTYDGACEAAVDVFLAILRSKPRRWKSKATTEMDLAAELHSEWLATRPAELNGISGAQAGMAAHKAYQDWMQEKAARGDSSG